MTSVCIMLYFSSVTYSNKDLPFLSAWWFILALLFQCGTPTYCVQSLVLLFGSVSQV